MTSASASLASATMPPESSRPDEVEELLEQASDEGGLFLHRVDPTRGMRRFYRLLIQPSLFGGEVDLIREWGRLGANRPRRLVSHHSDLWELLEHLREALRRRLNRGYRAGPVTLDGGPLA